MHKDQLNITKEMMGHILQWTVFSPKTMLIQDLSVTSQRPQLQDNHHSLRHLTILATNRGKVIDRRYGKHSKKGNAMARRYEWEGCGFESQSWRII